MSTTIPTNVLTGRQASGRMQGSHSECIRAGHGGKNTNIVPTNNKPVFRGETEGMNGHIFQAPGEQHNSTQFNKTVKILDAYVKKNMM
jgi:hypothetical protein